jgi:serine protease Do
MKSRWIPLLAGLLTTAIGSAMAQDPPATTAPSLRTVLNDAHAEGADHWVYNDLETARAEARKLNRPIFVTFRCVPCKACSGFDAEVAKGSELIKTLAMTHFVALRQVEMKGVDLSQFQFDYDLNWAAMFINADGTVYGRYGTQSAEGPDAFNSIASLEQAMMRVLKLHAAYPTNAAALAGKRGPTKPYKTALEMPELADKEKRRGPTVRNNCIHCHNIHDAENEQARKTGTLTREMLWRYPLPDNVGLHIDRDDGCKIERVTADSLAAKAGLKAGDVITHVSGQPIISIADIQWVLHELPNNDSTVQIGVAREGKSSAHAVKLSPGWKETDFSWRGSRWSLKPRPGFWAPEVSAEDLKKLGLPEGSRAYRIQFINGDNAEGRAAKAAGLRSGDVIVTVADKPVTLSPAEFQMHVRLDYKVGDKLPLTVLRNGQRERLELPLVE